MPALGKRWRFVTIGTHNSWRPGDKRGWRSRNHKRHSSGDYRIPPPLDEHEGLRRWVNERAGDPVIIPKNLRGGFGTRIIAVLNELNHSVLAISVSGMHCHIVVEFPDDVRSIKAIIGETKRASSRAMKSHMPGTVWAAGGDFDPIDSKLHLLRAVNYVLTKQGPGAWTWSFRQPMPDVIVKVRRPKGNAVRKTRGGA